MNVRERLEAISPRLRAVGAGAVELYLKTGRSRRYEIGPAGRVAAFDRETGWAVRASGARASLFACGTGEPNPDAPWPEPDGHPLPLPAPRSVPPWQEPADLDAPLMVEAEAMALLEGLERHLTRELPRARMFRASVVDGASHARLASTVGVEAEVRARAATLFLEAGLPGGRHPVRWQLAARQAAQFEPAALARRLVDRVVVLEEGGGASHDRGEVLLAPPAASALLEGLLPLFVGPRAAERARALRDRSGRLGSGALTVIDDGRLPDGVLSAAVDGEGMPTRQTVVVEEGIFRRPLLSWSESPDARSATGCCRRPSWRDPPRPGPTQLYLAPDPRVAPAELVQSVTRGVYLLDVLGAGVFDFNADRFRLPVYGFSLRRGRAAEPWAEGWLEGGIGALLHGIQAVARDLDFRHGHGLLGAPTMLVTGLEISDRRR